MAKKFYTKDDKIKALNDKAQEIMFGLMSYYEDIISENVCQDDKNDAKLKIDSLFDSFVRLSDRISYTLCSHEWAIIPCSGKAYDKLICKKCKNVIKMECPHIYQFNLSGEVIDTTVPKS